MFPAPAYKEGLYSTQYYGVTEDEKAIMSLRRRRPNPALSRVADEVLDALGERPAELVGADKLDLLSRLVKCNAKAPMLDLNYYSQYEPGLGIRVNVEAIHNNKAQGFLAVLASVLPPGSYYEPGRQGPPKDAFIFTEPDFDSHTGTPKFSEGDACVLGFQPQGSGMSLLIDIKLYLPDKGTFVDYGYTICPLLEDLDTDADDTTTEWYVSSGVFTLPIYKGALDPQLARALSTGDHDPMALLRAASSGRATNVLANTSAIVRIVDTQRKMHFLKSFDEQAPSLRYLEPARAKELAYKPITGGLFGGPKKLKELVPKEWKGKL